MSRTAILASGTSGWNTWNTWNWSGHSWNSWVTPCSASFSAIFAIPPAKFSAPPHWMRNGGQSAEGV